MFVCLLKTDSYYVALAGLEFTVYTRLASKITEIQLLPLLNNRMKGSAATPSQDGAGELTQRSRLLVVHAKDTGLFPSLLGAAYNHL